MHSLSKNCTLQNKLMSILLKCLPFCPPKCSLRYFSMSALVPSPKDYYRAWIKIMSNTVLGSEPLKVKFQNLFLQKQSHCYLKPYVSVISHFTLRLHKRASFYGGDGNNFSTFVSFYWHGIYICVLSER
jgi:hypothetical protein